MSALHRNVIAAVLVAAAIAVVPAQAPPRMQLVLLGTGMPRPDNERAGPSSAVVIGDKVFIVDAGRGAVLRLAAARLPLKAIQAVFLTHLHSDHIDGLPDLYHSTWQFGRTTPFQLYGPKGTDVLADAMRRFYDADIHIRRDLTEKLGATGVAIDVHDVHEGVVYDKPGEARVTAFLEDHRPVEPAYGYRFDSGGHSIVITGDTRPNPNLIRFASGADILVHEAYLRPPQAGSGNPQRWTIQQYHSSAAEAGEDAEAAKVKTLVLTHLIPPGGGQRFIDEAATRFHGRILLGQDLLRVDVAPPE